MILLSRPARSASATAWLPQRHTTLAAVRGPAIGAAAVVERHDGMPPGEKEIAARMRAEGLSPHGWGNGPGDTYGWHEHGYQKVLYCVRGRIVFHTVGGDIELGPGDKMVLPPHTAHAATVAAEGRGSARASRRSPATRPELAIPARQATANQMVAVWMAG
jgi:hypothetical protein